MAAADSSTSDRTMHVWVDGTELREALSIWRRMKASRFPAEAQVYRDEESLVIDSGGNAISLGFSGQWLGVARAPMYFILGLANRPPNRNSVEIWVSDDKFHIGTSSIGCAVQLDHEDRIGASLDASLASIVTIGLRHEEVQIKAAGLERAVDAADRKATRLIDKAMVHLIKLGITREQLALFVREMLSENGK